MTTTPGFNVSPLWAAPDHPSLITAALDVAAADGLNYLGRLLAAPPQAGHPSLISNLLRGSADADYPASRGYVLHLYHFHHPWSHRGYGGWCLSAAEVAERLFLDGLVLWSAHRQSEAAYELGRACHLLADLWIPHHAAGVAGCGHGDYEEWLAEDSRWKDFVPGRGGRYQWQAVYEPEGLRPPHVVDWRRPADWVDLAAHEAWGWYIRHLNACHHRDFRDSFPLAAARLVPGAVQSTAGFLHYFFTLALGKERGAGE